MVDLLSSPDGLMAEWDQGHQWWQYEVAEVEENGHTVYLWQEMLFVW